MGSFVVKGGASLRGTVSISGSKNAALPILAATLLVGEPCRIRNVPFLLDVDTMCELLSVLGCEVKREGDDLKVAVEDERQYEAPYEVVSRMRASICVLGPLIASRKKARVALPGGCAIGNRPVDLHIKGLKALGAKIEIKHGYIEARANRLKGAEFSLRGPFGSSVLATANVMMAATLAEGTTVIHNAACEPEIQDLARFLNFCGARISHIGEPVLRIDGVKKLHSTTYTIIPDRIEAATFLLAGAITNSKITVKGVVPEHLSSPISRLKDCGVVLRRRKDSLTVLPYKTLLKPLDITTSPYPGFPTDLQAQMMALLSIADGISIITEGVFIERFMHIAELNRMGANIRKEGASAIVVGVRRLYGAPVSATDLRASAALLLAALVAEGETTINNIEHIDRGYERIEDKLRLLGVGIRRITTYKNNDENSPDRQPTTQKQ